MRTRMKGFCLFTGLLLMCFAAFGEEASVEKDLTGASVDVAAVLLVENEDASAQDSVSISEAPACPVWFGRCVLKTYAAMIICKPNRT